MEPQALHTVSQLTDDFTSTSYSDGQTIPGRQVNSCQSMVLSAQSPQVVVRSADNYGAFAENVETGESSVWKYFLKSLRVRNVAQCKECKSVIKCIYLIIFKFTENCTRNG